MKSAASSAAPTLSFPRRITARRRPPIDYEIVLDGFAGVGGWGLGEEHANGYAIDLAFNHDANAVHGYRINHPATRVLHSDAFEVHPLDPQCDPHRRMAHGHFSPDCTDFSKAKGGAPVSDRVRGLAWIVIAWGFHRRPRVLTLENVEEFSQWGPTLTINGKRQPDPVRRGQHFEAFTLCLSTGLPLGHPSISEVLEAIGPGTHMNVPLKALHRGLGYRFEHREIIACDHGAATIRKRFYMVAKCDGGRIIWPPATHGPPTHPDVLSGKLEPHRTAAEFIDFNQPCPSVLMNRRQAKAFTRRTGRRIIRPLARSTQKRIAKGIEQFLINPKDGVEPFIVMCNHGGEYPARSVSQPMRTLTSRRDAHGVVDAALAPFCSYGQHGGANRSVNEPHHTITASRKDTNAVIAPVLVPRYGERAGQAPRCRSVNQPAATVVPTGNGDTLVSACMVGAGGPGYSGKPRRIDRPGGTLLKENHQAIIRALLTKHYTDVVGTSLNHPSGTITSWDHHALTAAHMLKMRGTCKAGQTLDEPGPTLTSGGNHTAIVTAILTSYYSSGSGKTGRPVNIPSPTIPATDVLAIAQMIAAPCGPDAVKGFLRVWNFLRRNLGRNAPMPIVVVGGQLYLIIDIGMRMLTPPELLGLQFGEMADGWVLTGSREQQTAGIGNSVCPHVARAIVKANVKIRRIESTDPAALVEASA